MKQADRNRRGVALIVVLGFLSIMVVMAVAFLTQARVERMVAAATLEAMRGRHMMKTALAAAMNDYSRYLWAENLVMPVELDDQVYPSMSSGAQSMGGRTIGDDGIRLMVGEVEDWIPAAYRTTAVSNMVEDAQWVVVRENPNSGSSRILGRYAFVCFDQSGGMDANLVARDTGVAGNDARAASNRVRRSVRQVPIRLLPEVLDGGTFKSYRSGWKGFDSLYSLIKLTDGKAEDGSGSSARWEPERKETSGPATTNISDLVPYSMSAYRGARYDRGSGLWTKPILCKPDVLWTNVLDPIKNQFPDDRIPDWLATNALYDYTHATVVPRGVDYPSPKNVPMFNEVAGSYQLIEHDAGGGNSEYELKLNLTFEFWYPFPSQDNANPGDFRMDPPTVGGSAAVSGDKQLWFRIRMVGMGVVPIECAPPAEQTIRPTNLTVEAKYNGGTPYAPSMQNPSPPPNTYTNFTYTIPLQRPSGDTNPLPSGLTLQAQGLNVLRPIYLYSGTNLADKLPEGQSFPGANLAGGADPKPFASGATDPRFNHEPGQWTGNEGEGNGSLNAMNDWFSVPSARNAYLAEGTNMYCRNGPLETPAELGFICTGAGVWQTIDLFTVDAVDMLAGLVADTNLWYTATHDEETWQTTNVFYTNGTINPNTRSSNVLNSAFVDLATHEVPNVDSDRIGANPLNEDTPDGMDIVGRIVEEILEETENGSFNDAFQAGTDWARIPCMRQGAAIADLGLNNNQREALLRNTWNLFSPENSLFTVVVIAQTIKEGPSGVGIWNENQDVIAGERRAVALVWRDPFKTGSNQHHEMYVRMFRNLND